MFRQVGIPDHRADADAFSLRKFFDLRKWERIDID
jgi:hypothetical protein